MRNLILAICSLALVLLAPSALAKKPEWAGKGKEKSEAMSQQEDGVEKQHREPGQKYSRSDREKIREHFLGPETESDSGENKGKGKGKSKQRSLPPGLQKKLERGRELPPGWQKKVAVGEVMEPELYEQSEDLPVSLERELGAQVGERHRRLGTKVIKVLEGEGTIIDVVDIMDGMSGDENTQ